MRCGHSFPASTLTRLSQFQTLPKRLLLRQFLAQFAPSRCRIHVYTDWEEYSGIMLSRSAGNSLLRLPLTARLPLRPSPFAQCLDDLAVRAFPLALSQRTFATPGRPRKTVGEPSKPVKRAVKRTAKAPSDGTDAASKQVKAKEKTAAAKKKKAKAAPKRTRKELTDAQKEARSLKLEKNKIAALKKTALHPPHTGKGSAWTAFVAEKRKGSKVGPGQQTKMADIMRPLAAEFKSLSPAELEV
jgi:hypothetical protein